MGLEYEEVSSLGPGRFFLGPFKLFVLAPWPTDGPDGGRCFFVNNMPPNSPLKHSKKNSGVLLNEGRFWTKNPMRFESWGSSFLAPYYESSAGCWLNQPI